jgi:hypothetical protein
MNPNIGHTTIPFNYQPTLQPHVTPFVPSKPIVLPIDLDTQCGMMYF